MVLADNPNRDELSAKHNSTADIALNTWEYHDFIDTLLDDKLSAAGLMKMKRLHYDISLSIIATPIIMFPFAWIGNKWLQGKLSILNRMDQKRYGIQQNEFLRNEYLLPNLLGMGLHSTSSQKALHRSHR